MIAYCTNIHAGESWHEVFANLQTHLPVVKKAVSPDHAFPIGLRLSHQAAEEMDERAAVQFLEWCGANGCYVPTLNGFPYGAFHGVPVKEKVYLPDWRHTERVAYTRKLADLLDLWLPVGVMGSISSVPVGFRKHVMADTLGAVRENLIAVLEHLDRLAQHSGKAILLSLEPEPGCVLETTEDFITFMEKMAFPEPLRPYLGFCFDCCHQAVEFEEAPQALAMLSRAGIRIGKVQASSALRFQPGDPHVLERFTEPCYLHQVVIRDGEGHLARYDDLPEALLAHRASREDEWRVHFHVPVFMEETSLYGTTQNFLADTIRRLDRQMLIEVETYTWDVLPRELQTETVTESIIREMLWVKAQRDEANRRP